MFESKEPSKQAQQIDEGHTLQMPCYLARKTVLSQGFLTRNWRGGKQACGVLYRDDKIGTAAAASIVLATAVAIAQNAKNNIGSRSIQNPRQASTRVILPTPLLFWASLIP